MHRERFPRHRLQRKPLVNDPGMQHGTCVTHVSWCMLRSLTRSDRESIPGIPGACATRNVTYLTRGPLKLHPSNRRMQEKINFDIGDNIELLSSSSHHSPSRCVVDDYTQITSILHMSMHNRKVTNVHKHVQYIVVIWVSSCTTYRCYFSTISHVSVNSIYESFSFMPKRVLKLLHIWCDLNRSSK